MLRLLGTLIAILSLALPGAAQELAVGSCVELVTRDNGIPGHASVGTSAVSERLPSGATVTVTEVSAQKPHWIRVRPDDTHPGTWIITKYVERILSDSPTPGSSSYVIGCWNLEHFCNGKTRGFPEHQSGGPTYPARGDSDRADTASVIRNFLDAKLLVLSEINGRECSHDDGEPCSVSDELDALLVHLGTDWPHFIGRSGGPQVALLYDTDCCRLNEALEIVVDRVYVEGKDVFSRDPLAARVSFLHGEQVLNDLVVVGLHLAAGQDKDDNHDRAMEILRSRLESLQGDGFLGGQGEADLVLMGDLNANMFSPSGEQFFLDMDVGRWDVLASPGYPATRLSGHPLQQRGSIIDYVIVSRNFGQFAGLSGDEVQDSDAVVHANLIEAFGGAEGCRRRLSDHPPMPHRRAPV